MFKKVIKYYGWKGLSREEDGGNWREEGIRCPQFTQIKRVWKIHVETYSLADQIESTIESL